MRKSAGVTLIELMITITILAILMAIGNSSYQYITNSNRIASEVNGLLGDLQYARGEAMRQGLTVTVCESTDGASCGGQTKWHGGWIVFSDVNGNASVDAGETVLRIQKPFTSTDTFVANNGVSSITFNREGFAAGIANGTFVSLHDATNSTKWIRCLSINLVGLIATQTFNTTANGVTCH